MRLQCLDGLDGSVLKGAIDENDKCVFGVDFYDMDGRMVYRMFCKEIA